MKFFYLLYDAAARFIECEAGYYAAAFSYYAPLALIPLLLFSITILGHIYGNAFVLSVFSEWGSVLGPDVIKIISIAINNYETNAGVLSSSLANLLGAVFFLSFCIIAFNVINDGFRNIWGTEVRGIMAWIFKSLRSVAFLFILQIYLVLSIAVEFFISPAIFGDNSFVASFVIFVSTVIFFATLYAFLVRKSPSWQACLVGAFVSSVLLEAAKGLVSLYIANTAVISLYGAAGLILILLIWVYILASLIFYGAAVAGLYDKINIVKKANN